jgi:predicted pyridoxine 5'-phosphate oxidase superfamily flavin-nucleotide-binding protein
VDIKYIDIKEFRELGYLQELNRQFLHPLGMALSVTVDEDGNEHLEGIWDYRDDPEGIFYDEKIAKSRRFKGNIEFVRQQWHRKEIFRKKNHRFMIQE